MLIAAGVASAAVIAGVVVWAVTDHSSAYDRSHAGCVNVTSASSMGGGVEHACGGAAQDWCRAVYKRSDAHAEAVQAQCRMAGITP